jgi:hypothetical protein
VRRVVARPEIPRRTVHREDLKAVAEPAEKTSVSEARFTIGHAGRHAVEARVTVSSFRPFHGEARVRVAVDGHELVRATYQPGNRTYKYARRMSLEEGEHVVRYTLDMSDATPDTGRAITVALEEVSVTGPLGTSVREYPPAHERLFFRGPPPRDEAGREEYARAILERVAERAFRRPVEPPTLERLVALARTAERQTGRFEAGIGHALQAILTSPRFLFRPEGGERLDELALATRLSYFLHGTAPDDELRALATRGELRANLPAQARRLIQDRKADRFVSRFVGQWLQTRDVENVQISPDRFKTFSPDLRRPMRVETEMLFGYILREDRDALELLTADYSFLNAALARHYGVPGVEGPAMRKVALPPESHRGGILTHGSFLLVTSNPTRTSPVKRGLFVLDNLLGAPPPPPPPNVPTLQDDEEGGKPTTMREQLAVHREKKACAACHARMDPIGLALESFDAIGRWRDEENGRPVDATARLVTGESIAGADQLRAVLAGRREQFYRALTRKLLVFALGRGLSAADECTVDALVAAMGTRGRLATLVTGIVQSAPFQQNSREVP